MKTTICYFLTFFVEAIILEQYTSSIFEPRTKKRYALSTLSVLYLLLFFFSSLGNFWLNTTAFLLINFIYIYSMYQAKFTLAFFHSSITTVIMGMCELLISGILSHFFPHFFANTAYYRNVILLAFFSKVLYFFILYLLAHYVIQRKRYRQYYDITTIFLGLVPIASCIITLTIVNLCNNTCFSSYMDYMIVLCAILLLAINLLVFGIHQYNQKKSLEVMEMQLLLQKEEDTANYYEMLLQQAENQSILIHDIKKHLQSIAILNEKRQHDQIACYIEQLQLSSGLKKLCAYAIIKYLMLFFVAINRRA